MHRRDDWPEVIFDTLQARLGGPLEFYPLGGMSGSSVVRVRSGPASVIVKASRSGVEAWFYTRVASRLREAGVASPDLLLATHAAATHWLVLEDIPTRLPYENTPNLPAIDTLARLHATTRHWSLDPAHGAVHTWTDEETAAAISSLAADGTTLATTLRQVQATAGAVYAPWCWISGDPNPLNWGLRADGTAVLYDWERFGPGTPAIDLAITVPGLGTRDNFARTAAAYQHAWSAIEDEPLPWPHAELTDDIAVAKVASVVQLLAAHLNETARVDTTLIAWLRDAVPDWVRDMVEDAQAAPAISAAAPSVPRPHPPTARA